SSRFHDYKFIPYRDRPILCLHMDPYVITFHLGLGIGVSVIGPAFYISLVIWDPIHLFGLLLNREIGLIVYLFDIIYLRHPPDNSNRSNWMSDSSLYDMTNQ
ncbi:hypothetical protein I3842_Q038300, partial [Carya illinoinensis]